MARRTHAPPPAPKPAAPMIPAHRIVDRVQTGVRMEKRLLKVLKGLAEDLDLTLGDLLEGVVLHAFEGKAPFSPHRCERIAELSRFYGLTLTAEDSHELRERSRAEAK